MIELGFSWVIFISEYVLITSGFPYGNYSEIIHLNNPNSSCQPLPEFPFERHFKPTGNLLNDSIPLICGGHSDDKNCYTLGKSEPVTSMLQPRRYASSVRMNGSLWITGVSLSRNRLWHTFWKKLKWRFLNF